MSGPADIKDGSLSSDASPPSSPTGGGPRDSQKTVFLSEVPEAKSMLGTQTQGTQALNAGSGTGGLASASGSHSTTGADPRGTHPTLSSSALAALSQRYEVLSEAGHGSMGNVYKARDRETGEVVALKLLKPEIASDQTMMERFKNELLFARKITHKNVCRVHDFNRINGVAYTSMEFVEGESLRSVLNRFGGLPVRKAINVALQICSGLKEAHAQGIVHRDLKPENVMVDAMGNVKIMDFGIARSMEAATRLTGSMVGTPAYMAPEQVAGKDIDYRTDIYSLGLILYEMFTGSAAFHADTAVAVALKQLREAPPPPHDVNPSIPVGIERAVLKCIEKEPEKRFQSIGELEKALGPMPTETALGAAAGSTGRSSNPTGRPVSTPPTVPPVAARRPEQTKAKGGSPLVWVLVGAASVLVLAGASRRAARAKSAEQIPPPAVQPHVPLPPDFAYDKPALDDTANATASANATSSSTVSAGAQSSLGNANSAAKPAAALSASANVAATPIKPNAIPKLELSTPKVADVTAPDVPPPDIRDTHSQKSLQPGGRAVSRNGSVYLWVNRFGKKERAQETADKLQEMGLPTLTLTRRGFMGDAFVLLAGPFNQQKADKTEQQLLNKGFHEVRQIGNPPQGFWEFGRAQQQTQP